MRDDTLRFPPETHVAKRLEPTINTRLVKYEDLNHHRTLFAGRGAEWLIEACFISAARAVGRPEDVVCVQINGMTFRKSANRGDLVEVSAQVGHVGRSSLTVVGTATINGDPGSVVNCTCVFVTVDANGKANSHGVTLPPEYQEAYRDVCAQARAAYESGKKGTG